MARAAVLQLALAVTAARNQYQWYLTRQFCAASAGSKLSGAVTDSHGPKRLIFLGTPQFAATVLRELLQAARVPDNNFEVTAVVSRPSSYHLQDRQRSAAANRPAGESIGATAAHGAIEDGVAQRHVKHSPQQQQQQQQLLESISLPPKSAQYGRSPVEQVAWGNGITGDRILCPISAKEPEFLETVRRLRPDLAITAAYGAILPQAFLDIPKYGTLNIHPSLLPRYRGAAPVTRALQDGCTASGVSLVFTVLKCDAGPVLEQQQVRIDPDIQAPELTEQMFLLGARMLLRQLPGLLSGAVSARDGAPQDETAASYAHKVGKEEAWLDFSRTAQQCHDHVRAMAGWPGAKASWLVENKATGTLEPLTVKILRTRVVTGPQTNNAQSNPSPAVNSSTSSLSGGERPAGTGAQLVYNPDGELLVPCGDGNMLSILEVGRRRASSSRSSTSSASRSYLTAKEFVDGLGKRRLFLPPATVGPTAANAAAPM